MARIISGPSFRSSTERGYAFEDLVADLFNELGYSLRREVRVDGVGIDIVAEKEGVLTAIEVSLPRKSNAMQKLRAYVARLSTLEDGPLRPLIVIGTDLTGTAKEWTVGQANVEIWDLTRLRERMNDFPSLLSRLDNLVYSVEEDKTAWTDDKSPFKQELDSFAQKLRNHIENNDLSPKQYELLCMDVCKFLFSPHLYEFKPQAKTSDGGNQFDFICRILPGNEFWDGVRYDFRTKAIIFECKNYDEKIGPDQIYSTERYLFAGALRTVCLLISRLGANKYAIRAAQGAMRESGKLIVLLSNSDLIEMLELRPQNGAVENFLDKRIWDFIVSLPR